MSDRRHEKAVGKVATARAEVLYERYKDALRRGHVAAMRGDIDEALAAYQEASRIAPQRPMARASAGLALARAGKAVEALPHFDAAVRLAPHDEATRAGRAEALASLGRNAEAAEDLDVVVDVRERADRRAEALDAAARALELAEARHRRRAVERLVEAMEGSEPDEAARAALAGAMRVLEAGVAIEEPGAQATTERIHGAPDARGRDAGPARGQAHPVEQQREPLGDPAVLAAEAEAALDAGDGSTARARLVELATANRAAGRIDAALDACYLALSVAPDDVDLHLALVDIYAERGWTAVASEKLDLLARLASLDGDDDAAGRIAAVRTGPG